MLTKIIDNSLIESILKDLKYHIIYYFDSLKCGNSNIQLDQDNINEAFLFNENKCLHIYRDDGLKTVLIEIEPTDKIIKETHLCQKRFKPIYGIEISKIIKYDDDGQAYILASIPSKLKMEGLV